MIIYLRRANVSGNLQSEAKDYTNYSCKNLINLEEPNKTKVKKREKIVTARAIKRAQTISW